MSAKDGSIPWLQITFVFWLAFIVSKSFSVLYKNILSYCFLLVVM